MSFVSDSITRFFSSDLQNELFTIVILSINLYALNLAMLAMLE